jgi:hypothetical protein
MKVGLVIFATTAVVPQSVAMSISGHRTVAVFQRYNITDTADQREAFRRTFQYRQEQQEKIVRMEASR